MDWFENTETIFRALSEGPTGLYYVMALGSVFSGVFWGFRKFLSPERENDKFLALLASKATGFRAVLENLYGRGIDGFLAWIDRRAGDNYLDRAGAGGQRVSPWSTGLYDFTLLLAVAYPMLFLFAGWVLDGLPPPGLEGFLGAQPDLLKRAAAVVGVGLFVLFLVKGINSRGWGSKIFFGLAVAVAVAVTFAGSFAFVVVVAVAVVVSVASVGVGAVAVAVVFAIAVAFVGAVAGVGVIAVAIAGAGAFAGAFAVAVVGVVLKILGRLGSERGKAIFYAVHWLVFLSGALAVLAFPDFGDRPVKVMPLIVFLGLLPLANAPLDLLSLGLTRWLLRWGRATGSLGLEALMSFIDLLGALVIMVMLAGVTAAAVSLANQIGPQPVLPLGPIFEGLREAPSDFRNLWIYLMLFSTLLPTAAHGVAGLAAVALAFMKMVFDAVWESKAFIDTDGKDAAKDNTVRLRYPALGALGVTGLVFLLSLLWWGFPKLAAPFAWFGSLLLAVAEGADGLVRGLF